MVEKYVEKLGKDRVLERGGGSSQTDAHLRNRWKWMKVICQECLLSRRDRENELDFSLELEGCALCVSFAKTSSDLISSGHNVTTLGISC